MDEVTRTITWQGPAARAGGLVELLEQQGVRVEWEPPIENRNLASTDFNDVVVYLICYGSLSAIKAVVKDARQRAPWAKIKVEGEDNEPAADEPKPEQEHPSDEEPPSNQ